MSTTRTRSVGTNPHIVISTKELQDPHLLEEFFQTQKLCQSYVIAVEYGETGHAHIESFSTWSKELRQDKIKDKICKLYKIEDYYGKMNTKVTFNHIDPEPMYGYGYAVKEKPNILLTNLDQEYINKSLQYYQDHSEAVNMAKNEKRKEYNKVSSDQLIEDFIEYLYKKQIYKLSSKITKVNHSIINMFDNHFNTFYLLYPKTITLSQMSKIKTELVNDYINLELSKKYYNDKEQTDEYMKTRILKGCLL